MFTNPTIKKILLHYEKIWAIENLKRLSGWDLEVFMPIDGVKTRGRVIANLSAMQQDLMLNKQFCQLIKLAKIQTLNLHEKAVIRILDNEIIKYTKIPQTLLEDFDLTTGQAQVAWREARDKNDFSLFAPYLEKIVELSKQKAEKIGYINHPYDALLDEYEEGLTTEKVNDFFIEIETPLKNLLNYIKNSDKYFTSHPLESMSYNQLAMESLNKKVLEFFNADKKKLRLDQSTHPFTQNISVDDVRITTRYMDEDFKDSLTATVHEYGHALYELQINNKFTATPLEGGVSLTIHESQSRFFENMIGKTKPFISIFLEDIKKLSPEIAKYVEKEGVEGVYRYFNIVKPSLIRVQADEVTYHLHIMLRFQLEKELIAGEIKVKDLPEIWNNRMESLLGVKPKTDTEGVLQDVHWSLGAIGYFPTYSLGTFNSGLILHELEKSLGNIDELINPQGIVKIQDFLKNSIHQHGSLYTPTKLLGLGFKSENSTKYLINYLNNKYKDIY